MADLGKVVVTDGGTYSATVTYEKLTFVHYNNDAYLTLKTVKGVTPTDDGVNYRLFCKSAATATTSKAGIVMPDGTTISISNGKITAKTATQTTVGVTKGSDDITVGKDGALSLNTNFKQATALANIVAGEALKVVLGKVSKAIATTMNLDENALLKNMISGIDVNDGNKVPSSAYIHTLVDRIGMGTELSGFDNLTAAVNSVNNNLSNANSKITRLYSDMSNLNKKTFSTYMSGDKDTDSVIASKQSDPYWTLTFGSNDSIGTIPTLTNVHLFTVIHWYLNDSAAMEHAYDTTGKLIAYRYKQWWIGAWSEWAKA